jgi:TonB family protein
MKFRMSLASLGLTIFLLGSTVALPPVALTQSQDAAAPDSNGKRKVKTKVAPDYPALAKQMNVTGRVKIEVTISMDGKVTSTKVIGGNPVLVSSSLDALKKWHFEAGPKQTTEVVEFEFNGQN